jgi:hypothetical protein
MRTKLSFRFAAVVTGLIVGLVMWVLTPRVHAAVENGIHCEKLSNRLLPDVVRTID